MIHPLELGFLEPGSSKQFVAIYQEFCPHYLPQVRQQALLALRQRQMLDQVLENQAEILLCQVLALFFLQMNSEQLFFFCSKHSSRCLWHRRSISLGKKPIAESKRSGEKGHVG